jgi:phosphatidate phosphatase APP1
MATNQKRDFKSKILNWLRLTDDTVIKVYHGYGHTKKLAIYGHVLKRSPLPRSKYRESILFNALALLRSFMVKPYANARLQMLWEEKIYTTQTGSDGFFMFEWTDKPPLQQGWNEVSIQLLEDEQKAAEGKGYVYVPFATQYGFISDVDDTFLISHSSNLRKRLYVLFTRNARSRKPFEGVVKHYQLLALGNTTPEAPNPFFYVSSSEWNLYDFLLEFVQVHKLPRGVFLLNVLKEFSQLLKTGQNNHQGKFTRIVRILENYPNQRFVLLGDSSQHDPYIYQSVVKHFPHQIYAVYIRDVYKKNQQKVQEVLQNMEGSGVPCCFFQHSSEAIEHSQKIGLITSLEKPVVPIQPSVP